PPVHRSSPGRRPWTRSGPLRRWTRSPAPGHRPCSSDTARPGPTARKNSPTSLFSTAPPETPTSWRCPRNHVGGRAPSRTAPAHVCQHLPTGRVTVALLVLLAGAARAGRVARCARVLVGRSEEHTSELPSRFDLGCRLLPETTNP